MFINASKALITLAAIATAAAAPANHFDAAACSFVLHPEVPVNASTNLILEFNVAIGDALMAKAPRNETWVGNVTWVERGDDFHVRQRVSAIGLSRAESAAIMNERVGTTLESFVTNWFVKAAHCV